MNTKDFFNTLQNHSSAKIEILQRYYIPWLRKINLGQFNNNKCLVIDGFAGEGIYEDGSLGSPIVIIDEALKFCNQIKDAGKEIPNVTIILIEGDISKFEKLTDSLIKRYDLKKNERCYYIEGYDTVNILLYNSSFESVMDKVNSIKPLRPSFCFVDPFGFSQTPFNLFEEFLKNPKSEILFNFMYEEINRFITHTNDKVEQQYKDLFGSDNLDDLKNEVRGKNAPIRKAKILGYYAEQLLNKTDTKYILTFEFKKKGRTKMFLIHSTKNIHGLALMKEVMWKVDETGAFLFDDKVETNQLTFEGFNEITREEHHSRLSGLIYEKFGGEVKVTLDDIKIFVLEETIYPLPKFLIPALKMLESSEIIEVVRKAHARKGTFNGKTLYINF